MKFVVLIQFASDLSKMPEIRPLHRKHMEAQMAAGKLLALGPWEDLTGGIAIFEAESADEVDSIIKEDPYVAAGIFASWEIKPWKLVMSNPEGLK